MKYNMEKLNEVDMVEEVRIKNETEGENWEETVLEKHEEEVDGWKKKTKSRRRVAKDKDKVEQFCRVCSEEAAGYHYGVFTCEGCKSFFGRYQKGKRKPPQECMNGGGKCDIKSRARNRCRYCRYQKCLSAGMSKSASRYGRRSNWFKVHCLSDSQDDLVKDMDTDEIDPTHLLSDHNNLRFQAQQSSPSHISIQASPTVANPKPLYAHTVSPSMLPSPSHLNFFIPKTSSIPVLHQFPLVSSTSPLSAFSPVLGHIPFSYTGFIFDPISPFHISPFTSQTPPIQSEPLDLSFKRSI